ncbi:MAG TPA: hypothetical protein PKC18_04810 [Lacipirellulaceae bacterium]|nr:hypothetical protein [Lacipirellulaceae bacterium]HMP07218.1 hypothetical protein [Lacipirellulaceae bacterium]
MTTSPVTAVGDAHGIVLPPEVVDRLKVVSGDRVGFVDTPNGVELQRVDEEMAEQLEAFNRVMLEDDEALRRLSE